jgi:hypothetical protein
MSREVNDDSLMSDDSAVNNSANEDQDQDERRNMNQIALDEEEEERTAENLYDEDILEE